MKFLLPSLALTLCAGFTVEGCKRDEDRNTQSSDRGGSHRGVDRPDRQQISTASPATAASGPRDAVLARFSTILRERWHTGQSTDEERAIYQLMAAAAKDLSIADLENLALSKSSDADLLSQVAPIAAAMALASKSPAELLRCLVENKDRISAPEGYVEGLRIVARVDSATLIQWIKLNLTDRKGDPMRMLCSHALTALALEAPDQFFSTALALNLDLHGPFIELADQDPVRLMNFIRSCPTDLPLAIMAAQTLAVETMASQPEMAIEAIGRLSQKDSLYPAGMFLSEWQRLDMKKAADYALKLTPSTLYELVVGNVLRTDALIDINPEFGKRIVDGVVATSQNSGQLQDLVAKIAKADPQNALAWVEAMDPTPFTKGMLRATAEQVFGSLAPNADPIAYLPATESQGRAEIIQGMANALGAKAGEANDLSGVQAISDRLPDTDRALFLESSLGRAGGKNPQAVMQALASGDLASELGADRLITVLAQTSQAWSASDPVAATAWAGSQPESPAKTAFVNGMIKGWVTEDPVAASKWLSNAPAGPSRNSGVTALADALEQTDPASAAEWRATLTR